MYGLEGILGNLVTSVATPAVGGVVGNMVGDTIENEFLKQLTETTTGMLAGAATGAGIGYLTGGKSGTLSGAITGGIGGGVGGYNAPEIANMFGMGAQPQQSVVAPQTEQPLPSPQEALQQSPIYQGIGARGNTGEPSQYAAAIQPSMYKPQILDQREPDYAEAVYPSAIKTTPTPAAPTAPTPEIGRAHV